MGISELKEKLGYLLRSVRNFNRARVCPDCGGSVLNEIDRKWLITRLYCCASCNLQFRFPPDDPKFISEFYQADYKADYSNETHSITDLPSESELQSLMQRNFWGKRDHSRFIYALLRTYDARVMDFGCSWGYSIFQLKTAGYDAEGFEISRQRAEFGKKIGVNITHDATRIRQGNDLIMSSHAIEHVPVISEFVLTAAKALTKDGIFMAFCPNGSPEYRTREPDVFHVNWGFLHPNYLDVNFGCHLFRENPYMIVTGDWDYDLNELSKWDGQSQYVGERRNGKELLLIAKPNINIKER